jgi:6-phospho-3-hexuloisomerase
MKQDVERILSELATSLRKLDIAKFQSLQREVLAAHQIFVSGTGRSGLMARAFVMRLVQLGMDGHVVGDNTNPMFGPSDLLLACTGSGSTETVLLNARKAKTAGGRIVAITAKEHSEVSKIAHVTLIVPMMDPNDLSYGSIQPIGTIFEQSILLLLDLLALELMKAKNLTPMELWKRHANLQ